MFIIAASNMNGQMTVKGVAEPEPIGEYSAMGTTFAQMEKLNGVVTLTYRDAKFTKMNNYKSFDFLESDLDMLYNLFTDFEGKSKGDKLQVNTEDGGKLQFEYKKMLGKWYAEVLHEDAAGNVGLLGYMTNKQLDKLFGKR